MQDSNAVAVPQTLTQCGAGAAVGKCEMSHTEGFLNLQGTAASWVPTKHYKEACTRQRSQSKVFENGDIQQFIQKGEKIGISNIHKYSARLTQILCNSVSTSAQSS